LASAIPVWSRDAALLALNMLHTVSQATGDGSQQINVAFTAGTKVDQAQVLVQNRVSIALPRLSEEVQRIGVTGPLSRGGPLS